jgi:hypothetical protein
MSSADRASIISPLAVTTGTILPVEIAPGSDVTVNFAFDSRIEGKLLPREDATPLCAADGVRITGAIEDSLEDSATPVASDVFHAGCM